tara:strand:- start:493 stop:888 length:396 start_codon:yes stop_codon:yes gene_type:complete
MKKVRVYWNLHKKVWSVQDIKSNRVVAHRQFITIRDAKFVVRKGGQKRVREEGKKNVHAFAVGYVDDKFNINNIKPSPNDANFVWQRVTYNPYKNDYFMLEEKPISKDWVGDIHMESLHYGNVMVAPRVYI